MAAATGQAIRLAHLLAAWLSTIGPELTEHPSGTHKRTDQEHQAALSKVSGSGRSALIPSMFSDMLW